MRCRTSTANLGTTQNHLSTGLAVASATDDAVKYFQSQSLTQRANDLSTRKSAIDQGIQSLTAATNGISGVISILQQMEGLVNGASTQTASQRASADDPVQHPGPAAHDPAE